MDQPTHTEKHRFLADCNARRAGWASFQRSTRRSAERLVRKLAQQEAPSWPEQ